MSRKTVVGSIIAVIIGIGLTFSYYVSQINVLPQSSYALFDQLEAPKATDRILVISPHQDDETIGAGGYLIGAERAGAAVEVIFATDGNKHGLKSIRQNEAISALKTLGVSEASVKFLNFPDGHLSEQATFESTIKNEIAAFRPTRVFTTLPDDLHPDHATCGRVVAHIAQSQPTSFETDFFLVHYHRYPRPIGDDAFNAYLLPPPTLLTSRYNWDVSPLSPADQRQKIDALKIYKSQTSDINPILKQLIFTFDQRNELFATLTTR